MTRRAILAPILSLALPLAACGVRDRPEARFHGHLTPSASSARCQPTDGVATIRQGTVTFAPDDGIWILEGPVVGDHVSATHSRLTPDHKSYDTELKATWTPTSIRGTYTTPFCTYQVDLAAY